MSKKPLLVNEKSHLLPRTSSVCVDDQNQETQEYNGGAGASFTSAVFNLSTTIVGAGIMALPATMKVLGLGLGILVIVFVALLTKSSLEMLLRFSKAGKVDSYDDVMRDSFGVYGKSFLQICVLLNNAGILIVYMIIIGDVLCGTSSAGVHHTGLLEGWFGTHWWNERTFVFLFMILAVFAPLACFKRMDSLRFSSTLAVALAVVFLLITAAITIFKLIKGSVSMPRLLPDLKDLTSFWNLFTVVPILVVAFICHINVHTIENELKDPSMIQPVVRTSLALCSTIYILTSLFGFLLFGDSILDDVLANFNTDLGIPYSSVFNDIVCISYALHLMLVFPVIFHPLRLNIDGLFFPSARPLVSDNLRFALITVALIIAIFLGANFIPSLWDVFQFTGATSVVCIGFIFPSAIALRDPHGVATRKDKIVSCFMIFLAVFSSLVAIYSDACAVFSKKLSSGV